MSDMCNISDMSDISNISDMSNMCNESDMSDISDMYMSDNVSALDYLRNSVLIFRYIPYHNPHNL
jgi:hypothetical protein